MFDDLARGQSEDLVFAFTVTDSNGGDVAQQQTITVAGVNDTPTVAAALTSAVSEEDPVYDIDLLSGADDLDNGALLNAVDVTEANGKGGWSVSGNTITIDPNFYDDLNDGEFETLKLNYLVEDEHGAAVAQSLSVEIEGYTDAPSLDVVVSAGTRVNQVRLTLTVEQAHNERVGLTFNGLPAGVIVLGPSGTPVTAGLANFVGTGVFTLVLPEHTSVNTNFDVKATGYRDDGEIIGETPVALDLSYESSSVSTAISFEAVDQNMWGAGNNIDIGWHEYIPLVGSRDGEGANAVNVPWSTGTFNIIDLDIDSADLIDPALGGLQSLRNLANSAAATALNNAVVARTAHAQSLDKLAHVGNAVGAWVEYEAKNILYLAAKGLYDAADSAYQAVAATSSDSGQTLAEAEAHLATLQSQRSSLESAARFTTYYWSPDPTWSNPFAGSWKVLGWAYDPIKYAKVLAKDVEIAAQVVVIAGIEAYQAGTALTAAAFLEARDALLAPMNAAKALKDEAETDAYAAQTAMWNAGFLVNQKPDADDLVVATWEEVQALADLGLKEGLLVTADAAAFLAQEALDLAQAAIAPIDVRAELKVDAEVYAHVGLQLDFELDLGSVDANVEYSLGNWSQYNYTTDVLSISPTLTDMTTGEDVAFSTLSPNVTFYAALLVDAGANIDIFTDAYAAFGSDVLFDASPNSHGIRIQENLGIDETIVLVDFDSTDTDPIEVPFIETLTGGVVSIELNIPTIETEGKAAPYSGDYFDEGGFISVDFSELSTAFFNFLDAGIDFSPEIKALFSDTAPNANSFSDLMDSAGEILANIYEIVSGDADTDGDGVVPIFILDATDETNTSLFHLNLLDDTALSTGVDDETASFGFFVSYGESEPIVEVTIDIDQFIALLANKAAGNVSTVVINPLVREYGLDLVLSIANVSDTVADQIKKYLNVGLTFEYADLDASTGWNFRQEFTLSIDDMVFDVKLEDGTNFQFNANDATGLVLENASQYDANNDGIIGYEMVLMPEAMFSNDTEIGMSIGYTLDIIKAQIAAGVSLPLDELIPDLGLPTVDLDLIDISLGPLLRVQGDLDLLNADLFENRFDFDLGSESVAGSQNAIDDVISGTTGEDELFGLEGNDILDGKAGNDLLSGGAGGDFFVFSDGDGMDTITDFEAEDTFQLIGHGITDSGADGYLNDLTMSDVDGNAVIDFGDGDTVVVEGVQVAQFTEDNFLFIS